MRISSGLLFTAAAVLSVSGCASFKSLQSKGGRPGRTAIAAANRHRDLPVIPFESKPFPYMVGQGFRLAKPEPAILSHVVTVRSSRVMGIHGAATLISEATRLTVHVRSLMLPMGAGGASSSMMMQGGMAGLLTPLTIHAHIQWTGPLSGLLDTVAARYGVYWRYRHGAITLFKYESRTYPVALPATATSLADSVTASGGVGGGGGGAAGGTGTGSSVSGASLASGSLTVHAKTTLDPYADTLDAVQQIVNESQSGGLAVASRSTGTVTVLAPPPVQEAVAQFIRQQNRAAARNVLVTVQVFQVQINRQGTVGGSLNLAFNAFSGALQGSVGGIQTPAPQNGAPLSSLSLIVPAAATGNLAKYSGSQAVVNALMTVGHVRLVTSGTVLTSNGQPAPLQVANQVSYLASSSTTSTLGAGATNSLTPGTVTVGFTSNFLPRLMGRRRILLQYQLQLSTLQSLNTITSDGSSIQVPDISEQSAEQAVVLRSGQTLVLAGFGQTQHTTGGGIGFIGGYDTKTQNRSWLVILIHVAEVHV
ncbi:MAG: hypothetical protein ACYDAZ_09155 [Thermoplasmataceae archaeon]